MTTKKKGTTPPDALTTPLSSQGGLLLPVATDDALVEGFKRYNTLKERLLEEQDYIWFAVVKRGDKESRKGFKKREEAEKVIEELRAKDFPCDLEKKIKKSGFLKLSKAFGISTQIVSEELDREAGYAYYKVRASAPNGQGRDRTGSCSRQEKGKGGDPYDSIQATAVTRAEGRAIMALCGGENTAEEFPEGDTPSDSPAADETPDRSKLSPEEQERLKKLDEKFVKSKPAAPEDDQKKAHLLRKMFALAKKAEVTPEQIKMGCINTWKIDSTKKLSIDQVDVIIKGLEDKISGKTPF